VPLLKAFFAGFLSTLVFHQGALTLFWLSGAFPRAPFDMSPVPPIGVPAVMSLAFWGGVWGIAIWPLLRHAVLDVEVDLVGHSRLLEAKRKPSLRLLGDRHCFAAL
jgi:hypothetical protein